MSHVEVILNADKSISYSYGIAMNKNGQIVMCNEPKVCWNCEAKNSRRNKLCFYCKEKLK